MFHDYWSMHSIQEKKRVILKMLRTGHFLQVFNTIPKTQIFIHICDKTWITTFHMIAVFHFLPILDNWVDVLHKLSNIALRMGQFGHFRVLSVITFLCNSSNKYNLYFYISTITDTNKNDSWLFVHAFNLRKK